jgi:cytochrome c peroxidase
MHAGQKETLADVVRFYSTLEGATQLDHHRESVLKRLDLTEAEQADLVAFLGALAGSAPAEPWNSPPGRNADAPTR